MSKNEMPRLPFIGKYARDRYTDLQEKHAAAVEAGLAHISKEDLAKQAGPLDALTSAYDRHAPGWMKSMDRGANRAFDAAAEGLRSGVSMLGEGVKAVAGGPAALSQVYKGHQALKAQPKAQLAPGLGAPAKKPAGSASGALRAAGGTATRAGAGGAPAAAAKPKAPKPAATPKKPKSPGVGMNQMYGG